MCPLKRSARNIPVADASAGGPGSTPPGRQRGACLELDGVSLAYQAGTPYEALALREIGLVVEAGERLAIAGPVGSGKSTLLGVLAGVQPPTTGRVLHDGREITSRSQPSPGSVGLAFQSPENCLFEKSVFDDIAFAPRRQGLDENEVKSRVAGAMMATGMRLEQYGHRSPFSLSTGEQRRVALAGVLAMEPRSLLLDEPTAHLDPAARRELVERLVKLNQETGMTLVMVGHDMDELARFARRVVIMEGGRMVADGPPAELLTDIAMLSRHSLDPPGTVELCDLLAAASGMPVTAVLEEARAVELLSEFMEARSGGGRPCR